MSEPTREEITNAHIQGLYEKVTRLEHAIGQMAWWLVDAQTGFGAQDAKGIDRILRGESNQEKRSVITDQEGGT